MSVVPDPDLLIVGQGLAGSLLSMALIDAGLSVLVVDQYREDSASRVAAGLLNPVTGRKLVRLLQADAFVPVAEQRYQSLEARLATRFFYPRPMIRLFVDEQQREQWRRRCDDPAYNPYLCPLTEDTQWPLSQPHGSGEQRHTGFIDTGVFLDAVRAWLKDRGMLLETAFDWEGLQVEPGGVNWRGHRAARVISCEGDGTRDNPWFRWLDLRSVKGQILTLALESALPEVIFNRGKWLLPLPDGRRARFGATYERGVRDTAVTGDARARLDASLDAWWPDGPPVTVIDQQAGIRPGTPDRMPVAGLHPEQPTVGLFNGFGSKGVVMMPYFAERFARHLLGDEPLPGNVDLLRYWPGGG